MTFLGHLGSRVSDLLDDRLDDGAAADAWAHVDGCAVCQADVEKEAWVKNTLSCLGDLRQDRGASEKLRDRLTDDALLASYAEAATWSRPPTYAEQRRHRWTVAAIGGGAVSAAMLGVIALGAVPTQAPSADRRVPVTSINFGTQRPTASAPSTPSAPSTTGTTAPAQPGAAASDAAGPSASATPAEPGEDRTTR